MRKQKKYHYIYKTTNLIKNYFYIGMHSTDNLEDGYFGSGKRLRYSINKYGKENHKIEILEFLPSREELKIREREIVNEDLLKETLCMNLQIGGEGGNGTKFLSDDQKKNFQLAGQNARLKKLENQEYREKFGKAVSVALLKEDEFGITPAKKILLTRIKNGNEPKKFIKQMIAGAQTPEAKKKRIETLAKIGHQQGEKNSQFGTRWAWVNNGIEIKKIKLELLNDFLQNGWVRGRK